ncbi:hypothetical protein ACQW02_16815 [Humitalea sp. 24SJ18S-53]|uniref:hypothetical protein n=1 Tax=Humitalea sp. 24SJ18S-53 TaxID=3422307 RepID=UPI003D665C95
MMVFHSSFAVPAGLAAPLRAIALLGVMLTAGCSGGVSNLFGSSTDVEASAVAPAPMGPVAAFVSRAVPGDQERMVLPDSGISGGGAVTVRLARAWNAASGRECREVQIGGSRDRSTQVYCQQGASWVQARPLLLGGVAAGRP